MAEGANKSEFVIDENVNSTYFYHIRFREKDYPGFYKSLCGENLLGKELDMKFWGHKSHVGESYCKKCSREFLTKIGHFKEFEKDGELKEFYKNASLFDKEDFK